MEFHRFQAVFINVVYGRIMEIVLRKKFLVSSLNEESFLQLENHSNTKFPSTHIYEKQNEENSEKKGLCLETIF